MNTYLTRVVLTDGTWDDYDNLHALMKTSGFKRTVTGDNKITYKLPDAMYLITTSADINTVRLSAAKNAATVVNKHAVFTTIAGAMAWEGLEIASALEVLTL